MVLAQDFPGCDVVGIDLSEPLLLMARQAAADVQLGERVLFDKGVVQQMPYEDHSFDVVININKLHLVDDPLRMLGEIGRVLLSGGYFFICDLRRSWLGLVEKEIRSAFSVAEARQCILGTDLRRGTLTSSLLWWHFEVVI